MTISAAKKKSDPYGINIGDTVKLVGQFAGPQTPEGHPVSIKNFIGVVRTIDRYGYGVEFFESFHGGHNLRGAIENTRGWNVNGDALLRLHPVKEVIKTFFSPDLELEG
jgi:hypothetical protein